MIKSKNISKKEVANILGVSESTVVRWSKYGDLPKPYLLGHNKTVWDRDEIYNWIENKKKVRGFLGYKPDRNYHVNKTQ
tara:strand:+ start:70 stop:306 length:237 start_codon:yes stop_codon:yes gene_type:complete